MTNIELAPKRLYLQIADELAALVKQGDIKVGERFPAERELAARFQVSRSTIREAMIALEVNNQVEIRSGSGIYALTPSPQLKNLEATDNLPGPFEILETRLMLEPEAAKLAAERISNTELHQLKQLLVLMEEASANGDTTYAELLDHQYHYIIVQATRNSALLPIYEWLWKARESSPVNKQFHYKLRNKSSNLVIQEHKAILNALMQRDGETAKNCTRDHLNKVLKRLSTHSFS